MRKAGRNRRQGARGWAESEAPAVAVAHAPAALRPWRWPVMLAALTLFGLLSALLGQHGVWHWLSWIALAIPLAVIVHFLARAARAPSDGRQRCRS